MTHTKFSLGYYLDVVDEHVNDSDGCLVRQLYEYLDKSDRPTYSSFRQRLKTVEGLRFMTAIDTSQAEFVTTKHGVPKKRK